MRLYDPRCRAAPARAATDRLAAAPHRDHAPGDFRGAHPGDDDFDERTSASSAVIAPFYDGWFDEAKQAARDLLARVLEVHDGYDRVGVI